MLYQGHADLLSRLSDPKEPRPSAIVLTTRKCALDQVTSYNHEEEALLEFQLTYHSGRSASVPEDSELAPAAGESDPIGRCLTLPAFIRFLPSLQVCFLCAEFT